MDLRNIYFINIKKQSEVLVVARLVLVVEALNPGGEEIAGKTMNFYLIGKTLGYRAKTVSRPVQFSFVGIALQSKANIFKVQSFC